MDPNIYSLQRQAPNGNWSSKVSLRAPYDLKRNLLGEGFSPEQIELVMLLEPGIEEAFDTV